MVVQACRNAMGLSENAGILIHTNDARMVLTELPANRMYDLIIGDAFNNGTTVPWQLTTAEFHRQIKQHLRPGGVMLTNIIDDYQNGGKLLGAYVQTVQKVFPQVRVFCTAPLGPGNGLGNFIIAAGDEFPQAADRYMQSLMPGHNNRTFPGSMLQPEHLASLAEKCGHLVLTDDYAPVENLISPAIENKPVTPATTTAPSANH